MGAAEPAEAPAERVADDAHVGRGAGHEAEAVLVGRLTQLHREHALLDPGGLRRGVDLDPPHVLGLDQDRSVEGPWCPERGGAVPGALAGDPQAVLGGKADDGGDVLAALDEGDRLGPLVGDQVPGKACLVPVGIRRSGDTAGDGQSGEVAHLGSSVGRVS